ncbi:hypothetical protein BH11ARM2_BH11ARM2_04780 [soil metagenome]
MTDPNNLEAQVRSLIEPYAEYGGLSLSHPEIDAAGHPVFRLWLTRDVPRMTPIWDLVGEVETEMEERGHPIRLFLAFPKESSLSVAA